MKCLDKVMEKLHELKIKMEERESKKFGSNEEALPF